MTMLSLEDTQMYGMMHHTRLMMMKKVRALASAEAGEEVGQVVVVAFVVDVVFVVVVVVVDDVDVVDDIVERGNCSSRRDERIEREM